MIQSFHATPAFRCNKILSPGAAEVQLEHRDTIFAGNPSPWAKIFSWLIWLNLNLQEGTQILMWWNIYFYPDGCVSSVLLQIVQIYKKSLPLRAVNDILYCGRLNDADQNSRKVKDEEHYHLKRWQWKVVFKPRYIFHLLNLPFNFFNSFENSALIVRIGFPIYQCSSVHLIRMPTVTMRTMERLQSFLCWFTRFLFVTDNPATNLIFCWFWEFLLFQRWWFYPLWPWSGFWSSSRTWLMK